MYLSFQAYLNIENIFLSVLVNNNTETRQFTLHKIKSCPAFLLLNMFYTRKYYTLNNIILYVKPYKLLTIPINTFTLKCERYLNFVLHANTLCFASLFNIRLIHLKINMKSKWTRFNVLIYITDLTKNDSSVHIIPHTISCIHSLSSKCIDLLWKQLIK